MNAHILLAFANIRNELWIPFQKIELHEEANGKSKDDKCIPHVYRKETMIDLSKKTVATFTYQELSG
jgi:hypothetical protein